MKPPAPVTATRRPFNAGSLSDRSKVRPRVSGSPAGIRPLPLPLWLMSSCMPVRIAGGVEAIA